MSWSVLAATIATVVAVCSLLDWMLSKEEIEHEKLTLVRWWVRLEEFVTADAIGHAAAVFNRGFDAVYGAKTFSLRRAVTSTVTTLGILTGVGIILASLFDDTIKIISALSFSGASWLLATNLILDFITLTKSRFLLKLAENAGVIALATLAIIDILSTLLIYLGLTFCAWLVWAANHRPATMPLMTAPEGYLFFICLFGAYGTSLIFLSYLVMTLSVRMLGHARPRLMVILERLSDSNDPFKSIGIVFGALLAIVKGVVDFIAVAL